MKKILCVLVVLVISCGLALSFGRASTAKFVPAPPLIVAKGRLVNQTFPIPQTQIYAPVENGLYRISAYATVTTPTTVVNESTWQFNAQWTDDAGYTYNGGGGQFLSSPNGDGGGSFEWIGQGQFGATLVLEAKGGTPICISMTLGGPPDNSAYSLYYTLERLE